MKYTFVSMKCRMPYSSGYQVTVFHRNPRRLPKEKRAFWRCFQNVSRVSVSAAIVYRHVSTSMRCNISVWGRCSCWTWGPCSPLLPHLVRLHHLHHRHCLYSPLPLHTPQNATVSTQRPCALSVSCHIFLQSVSNCPCTQQHMKHECI